MKFKVYQKVTSDYGRIIQCHIGMGFTEQGEKLPWFGKTTVRIKGDEAIIWTIGFIAIIDAYVIF